ncbi:MAG: HlyD family secretion protein, partial [Nitrospirales bacterium]
IEATIREKQAKLKMLEAGARPEEIALAQQAVSTAKTRQEEARKRYDEARRLREERLTRAQATEQKVREQLRYAEQSLNRLRPLLDKEFISQKDFQDAQMEVSVRRMELEEAQATLHMVLADGLSAFSQETALAGAERKEAESRLRLLLAGSRPEEIEATQAEIASLVAQQRHLQHKLERVWIRSPHAGVITTPKMKEKIGQQVQKGDLIAEVHELKTVMAEISVPEGEIADVAVGQPIALKARAYPGLTFTGTVTEIAPAVLEPKEESSAPTSIRAIRVLTQIDNTQGFLKSRMTGYGKISCGEQPLINLMTRRIFRYLRVEFWSWW